jgi:hypothetical protein
MLTTSRQRGGSKFLISPEGTAMWPMPSLRINNAMVKALTRA